MAATKEVATQNPEIAPATESVPAAAHESLPERAVDGLKALVAKIGVDLEAAATLAEEVQRELHLDMAPVNLRNLARQLEHVAVTIFRA